MTKVFYSLVIDDRTIDIGANKELRDALKNRRIKPFDCDNVLSSYLCCWLEEVAGKGVCQVWWWESSPPASLPQVGQEVDVTDFIPCRIRRCWKGVDVFAVLEVVPKEVASYTPVFVTVR